MEPREVVAQMDKRYALFGSLFAINNRLQAVGDRFYEEITCKQFFMMACMNLFQDGDPSLQELAQVMGCSHQNVKSIVTKLCDKGLLRMYADGKDKRKQRVALTEKAGELGGKYSSKETDFINQLFAGLGEQELAETFATLMKMETNLMEISRNINE